MSAATASECVTPRASVTAPTPPGSSWAGRLTWTSPPVAKMAWSEANPVQLVLRERERASGNRHDQQQRRATLADRHPAELPPGQ